MIHTRLFVALSLSVMFLGSCLRPIDTKWDDFAVMKLRIDWSESGLSSEEIRRASVWVFPHNAGSPSEVVLEENLQDAEFSLPLGTYSLLVFNETADQEDWTSLSFSDTSTYETFKVRGVDDLSENLFSVSQTQYGSTGLRSVCVPERHVAVWRMDNLEITPDIANVTRSGGSSRSPVEDMDKTLNQLQSIRPVPLTRLITVRCAVRNLISAARVSAALSGFSSGITFASAVPLDDPITHVRLLNNRVYDQGQMTPIHGTMDRTFLIYGSVVNSEAKYTLQLDFLLRDNTQTPPEVFDITDQVRKSPSGPIVIDVGRGDGSDPTRDRPIVLPIIDADADINVGLWDSIDINIGLRPRPTSGRAF